MLITRELVALRWEVWVLDITSLTSVVQRSTQHRRSTVSKLTHLSRLTAKH